MKISADEKLFMGFEDAERRMQRFLDAIADAPTDVEKAVTVQSPDDVRSIPKDTFRRAYFGPEFCDRATPSPDAVREFVSECRKAGLQPTLVTAYHTDATLDTAHAALRAMHDVAPDAEVVVNDYGVLRTMRDQYPTLRPVLGRLLAKQKRDPRIAMVKSAEVRGHFSRSSADGAWFRKFLEHHGVTRIELDNLLQGVSVEPGPARSMHYPLVFVTTGRECLDKCDTCRSARFFLLNREIDRPLLLVGRAQFYVNMDLKNLSEGGFSRVVYHHAVPL